MNAAGHVGSLVGVARRAFDLRHFAGMGEILEGGVAGGAAERAVDAGRMFDGIDRDTFATVGLHPGLAVAGEAGFVLLERMRRLCSDGNGQQRADGKKTDGEKQDQIDDTASSGGICGA